MSIKETLKPLEYKRVIDLVREAGVDVRPWSRTRNGTFKTPANNPKYCYEWAFRQQGKVIVLNVWHQEIKERNGKVWCKLNPLAWSEEVNKSAWLPSERGSVSKRAGRLNEEIEYAFNNRIPVRLIIGQGTQRDLTDPESKSASRMLFRLLDPEPWSVQRYNKNTGACHLVRGSVSRYVDQYTAPKLRLPIRHQVTSQAYERERRVRDAALKRAGGKCEYCHQPGFLMEGDRVYLETHHVVPLSEHGEDHERNVAAICPNDHREAHHGKRRSAIRAKLLKVLAERYSR